MRKLHNIRGHRPSREGPQSRFCAQFSQRKLGLQETFRVDDRSFQENKIPKCYQTGIKGGERIYIYLLRAEVHFQRGIFGWVLVSTFLHALSFHKSFLFPCHSPIVWSLKTTPLIPCEGSRFRPRPTNSPACPSAASRLRKPWVTVEQVKSQQQHMIPRVRGPCCRQRFDQTCTSHELLG